MVLDVHVDPFIPYMYSFRSKNFQPFFVFFYYSLPLFLLCNPKDVGTGWPSHNTHDLILGRRRSGGSEIGETVWCIRVEVDKAYMDHPLLFCSRNRGRFVLLAARPSYMYLPNKCPTCQHKIEHKRRLVVKKTTS